ADDIELREARAGVRGAPDRALAYAELARTVHFRSNALKGLEPSLEATVHYTNPQAWTFTNGAHLAVVEIDVETGRVRVLRYVAVDDCGRIVNPALVEGQIAGGIAQGLGGALLEHCVYDDAGQLLTTTLMDYAVPTSADLPPIEMHHIETPAPGLGGRSAGLRQRADTAVHAAEGGTGLLAAGSRRQDGQPRRSTRQSRDALLLGHVVNHLPGGVASRPEGLSGLPR